MFSLILLQGQIDFPILSEVARQVLAIPAASASAESVFSDASGLTEPKRSNMAPNTLNDHLVLRDHLKNIHK